MAQCRMKRFGTVVAVAALALSAAAQGAPRPRVATPAAKAATPATGAPLPNSPGKQGIKVSGWWTMNVLNPDGTLVSHVEFENSLQVTNFLPGLLVGAYSIGVPNIGLFGPYGQGSPLCSDGGCGIFTPGYTDCPPSSPCSSNLTVAMHAPTPNSLSDGIVLSGTFTAYKAGSISAVNTGFSVCGHQANTAVFTTQDLLPNFTTTPSKTTPADCLANHPQQGDTAGGANFTGFALNGTAGAPPPVVLAKGQILQVTVVLTFS